MRRHRFFVDADLHRSSITVADEHLCHQLHRVLRLQSGDGIVLVDGKGSEADARIESLTPEKLDATIIETRLVNAEPKRSVTLCAAVLKRENFEWLVQKATEVGVKKIVPVITARTVKTGLKLDRLRIIAREASEQCGRGVIPTVESPIRFAEALASASSGVRHVFLHFGGDPDWASSVASAPTVSCWIGPEGGWTDEEAAAAKNHGFLIGSLGDLALRAETAGVVASFGAISATE